MLPERLGLRRVWCVRQEMQSGAGRVGLGVQLRLASPNPTVQGTEADGPSLGASLCPVQ